MSDETPIKIQKVSKYIPVSMGTSGNRTSTNSTVRNMLLSIPRIAWLERPGPPTDYYHEYKPPDADIKLSHHSYSDEWCEKIKTQPMTDREQIVQQMLHNGATFGQIATRLGLQRGSIANYVARVRIKEAYQSWKRDTK
jgi:DNA-binding NarL/FixJ family response regulator